jgi:hypothetical protein
MYVRVPANLEAQNPILEMVNKGQFFNEITLVLSFKAISVLKCR